MNKRADMWGDLRSRVHNGSSSVVLSDFLSQSQGSAAQESMLAYIVDHKGGSPALWLGLSQGLHCRLSWLLPHMERHTNHWAIQSALSHTTFQTEHESGLLLQALQYDTRWLIDWQLHLLKIVSDEVLSEDDYFWRLFTYLESLVPHLLSAIQLESDQQIVNAHWSSCERYAQQLDQALHAQHIELGIEGGFNMRRREGDEAEYPVWERFPEHDAHARLLNHEAVHHILDAMQHIVWIDAACSDYNAYRATQRVGNALGNALKYNALSLCHIDSPDERAISDSAAQTVLSNFAQFMLNKSARQLVLVSTL